MNKLNKINIESYAKIAAEDQSLLSKLYACTDTRSAIEAVQKAIAASGFELAGLSDELTCLPDDALESVTGGANPFIPLSQGEINPYSWFVSFLRMLMGLNSETESAPQQGEAQSF
ncbi:MAG: hypothetical protein IJQ43_08780 [Oscillospiraceae bacterium]|nr:hypothetical protein [Oscillospiraceae bacterium]